VLGVVAVLLLSPKPGALFRVFGEAGAAAALVSGVACVAAETSVPAASPLLAGEVLAIWLGAGFDTVLTGSSCAQATSTAVLKSAINVVFKLNIFVLLKVWGSDCRGTANADAVQPLGKGHSRAYKRNPGANRLLLMARLPWPRRPALKLVADLCCQLRLRQLQPLLVVAKGAARGEKGAVGWLAGHRRRIAVGSLAYLALIALLRLSGKLPFATLSNFDFGFDFDFSVALGSKLATVPLSRDVTPAEGVASCAVLCRLQWWIAWLSVRSRVVSSCVKSDPTLLLRCAIRGGS